MYVPVVVVTVVCACMYDNDGTPVRYVSHCTFGLQEARPYKIEFEGSVHYLRNRSVE